MSRGNRRVLDGRGGVSKVVDLMIGVSEVMCWSITRSIIRGAWPVSVVRDARCLRGQIISYVKFVLFLFDSHGNLVRLLC